MPERDEERVEEEAGARAFWSGTISFGLVSIPVQLLSAHRAGGVALRSLAPDGTPLRREYFCPEDEAPLAREEIVRGWELDDGSFVTVTDEELEGLEPERSRDIDLRRFVPRDEVGAGRFQRAYYLAPAGESLKAYRLLAGTLETTDRVGIATFVLRGREQLVAILAQGGVLRAIGLRFADELRDPSEAGLPVEATPDRAALKRFQALIESRALDELPADALVDEAAEQLRARAAQKLKAGQDVVELADAEPDEEAEGEPEDVLEVLRRSLREGGRRGGAPRSSGERSARRRRAKSD